MHKVRDKLQEQPDVIDAFVVEDPFTFFPQDQNKGGSILDNACSRLELARRDVLLTNSGRYAIPDEQLHFPYLYESENGNWYMTYREGPHLEAKFGPGNH